MESKGLRRRLDLRPLVADHPVALRTTLVLWLLGASLFLALQLSTLAAVVQNVDDIWHQLAIDLESPLAVGVALALNFLGSTWVTLPVMAAVAAYLAWARRWEGLAYWTLAMLFSQLLIGPVKVLYGRPRPPASLVETTSFSFPSGHAVAGAAIAISLVIVLVPAGPKRRNLEMLAAAFAVIMGLSRVYLRAHWLSDVVAGVALGAAVAIGTAVAMHYLVGWGSVQEDDDTRRRSPEDPAG